MEKCPTKTFKVKYQEQEQAFDVMVTSGFTKPNFDNAVRSLFCLNPSEEIVYKNDSGEDVILKFELPDQSSLNLSLKTTGSELISIILKTMGSKKYLIRVKPNAQIKDIKNIINEKEGVPPEMQLYFFLEIALDDNATIASYEITNGSTLRFLYRLMSCEVEVVKNKTVRVKDLKGDMHDFTGIELSSSVDEFKVRIQDKLGLPPNQLHLVCGGSQLENGKTLEGCDVRYGSLVRLVLPLIEC